MELVEAQGLVSSLYRGILKREPDAIGLERYTSDLIDGTLSTADVASLMSHSEEHKAQLGIAPVNNCPTGCTAREAMEVFEKFSKYTGLGCLGYITNFLGGLTATQYVNLPNLSEVVESYPIPRNFHADTLEWLGTLRAVLDARTEFNMIELGAGWAPWCTIGYIAAERKGLKPHVTAVEGDAGHVEFIHDSFKVNGQAQWCCKVLHGIVGAVDGQASFPRVKDGSRAYGGSARYDSKDHDEHFEQFMSTEAAHVAELDVLPCYSLTTLLRDYSRVDLIHCDVQGAEFDVFAAGMDVVSQKVSRVVIGTHSFDLDRRLVKLFSDAGWTCEGLDAVTMVGSGDNSRIECDGTQVWRNDRLA